MIRLVIDINAKVVSNFKTYNLRRFNWEALQFAKDLHKKTNQLCISSNFRNEIVLDCGPVSLQILEVVWCNELLVWIFFLCNKKRLLKKHKEQKRWSLLLHQALTTGTGQPRKLREANPEEGCAQSEDNEAAEDEPFGEDADRFAEDVFEPDDRDEGEEECWVDEADNWARSEDDGWFYDDDKPELC